MRETDRIPEAMAWPCYVILLGATRAPICANQRVYAYIHIHAHTHDTASFRGCSVSFEPLSADGLYTRISFARKHACGGERFCLLTNNLCAMPESAVKRTNAHYDLAKWDIKFPLKQRSFADEYYVTWNYIIAVVLWCKLKYEININESINECLVQYLPSKYFKIFVRKHIFPQRSV